MLPLSKETVKLYIYVEDVEPSQKDFLLSVRKLYVSKSIYPGDRGPEISTYLRIEGMNGRSSVSIGSA